MTEWNPCKVLNTNYICDEKLVRAYRPIMLTLELKKGRRKVEIAFCERCYIRRKFNGKIIAWGEVPMPYEGEDND